MKVSSPVGDYPYVVKKVRFSRGRLIVEGSLGIWETTMAVEPSDWLEAGRRAALPLLGLTAVAIAACRRRR